MTGSHDDNPHGIKRQMREAPMLALEVVQEDNGTDDALSVGKARQPSSTPVLDDPTKPPILKLPNEVLCMIFARLDECSSVCLGLTHRSLWTVHLEFSDPKISLYARSDSVFLHQLLGDWMTEFRRFCHWTKGGKFIEAKDESESEVDGDNEEPVTPTSLNQCGCMSCSPSELAKLAKFKADVEEAELKLEESRRTKSAVVKIRRKLKQADVHRRSSGGRR